MSEARLEAALFPTVPSKSSEPGAQRSLPDLPLARRAASAQAHHPATVVGGVPGREPDGYGYSRSAITTSAGNASAIWCCARSIVRARKLFVDWAGADHPSLRSRTGAEHAAPLFVGVLRGPVTTPTRKPTGDQQMASWIGSARAHLRVSGGLSAVGGTRQREKRGVSKALPYEPDLNPTYQEMALHYGHRCVARHGRANRATKPSRSRRADCPALDRGRAAPTASFFSLRELNHAIERAAGKLNNGPSRNAKARRRSLLWKSINPRCAPLPAERFDLSVWSQATGHIDYHIQFERSFYSVPYQLTRQTVESARHPTTIEIFIKARRVAVARARAQALTGGDQLRASARLAPAHLDWPPSRMIQWAAPWVRMPRNGERILASFPHPEMGYRSCLGHHPPGPTVSQRRAWKRPPNVLCSAVRVSYKSLESILRHQSRSTTPEPARFAARFPFRPQQHPWRSFTSSKGG